eukprot:gene19688-6857_t
MAGYYGKRNVKEGGDIEEGGRRDNEPLIQGRVVQKKYDTSALDVEEDIQREKLRDARFINQET